jgi:hypothetical protein
VPVVIIFPIRGNTRQLEKTFVFFINIKIRKKALKLCSERKNISNSLKDE